MIYVLGSLNMDMVAAVSYMPVNGETMSADRFYVNCGGKGNNQAVAIAKLGGAVRMIGKVGPDANGSVMKSNLVSSGVDATFVTEGCSPSGIAMIIVENGDNRIILSAGANYDITEEDVDEGLGEAQKGDYLIMQLEVPLEIVEYAAALAKKKGMTVILNPAPAVSLPECLLCNVDIICPNESEAKILTGIDIVDDVSLALTVKTLYKIGVKQVVITMGSRGAIVTDGYEITQIAPRKVEVVDTTGAGDAFFGAMTLMLASGKSIVEAGRFASVASSITITREGAAKSIPMLAEVEKVING